MTSNYSSDPRVPPARVEHLGKHHKATGHAPVGLPARGAGPDRASAPTPRGEQVTDETTPAVDAGPTYADFLDDHERSDELPGKTG